MNPVSPASSPATSPPLSRAAPAAGKPPDTLRPKKHYCKTKCAISLVLLAPRVAIGSAYLASSIIKGIVGGIAVGIAAASAKKGPLKGKAAAIKSFGAASLREARKDVSRALLLSIAGVLAPIGHGWAAWDVHENQAPTGFTVTNLGSADAKRYFGIRGRIYAQNLIDPERPKEPNPHIWRKIDSKLDSIANFITQFKWIEHAIEKASEPIHLLREKEKKPGGP